MRKLNLLLSLFVLAVFLISGTIYAASPTINVGQNLANSTIYVHAVAPANYSTDAINIILNGNNVSAGVGIANYTFTEYCAANYSFQAYDVNQGTYSSNYTLNVQPCTTANSIMPNTLSSQGTSVTLAFQDLFDATFSFFQNLLLRLLELLKSL